MNDTTQTQDNRSSRQIQEDIRGKRSDMDQTLDSLNDRLSPRALINGFMEWFDNRDSSSSHDMSRKPKQIARFVRDNPVPALLTGIGVAWLIAESQSEDDEPDFDRFSVNHNREEDSIAAGYRRNGGISGDPTGDSRYAMQLPPYDSDMSDDNDESVMDKVKDKLSGARDQIVERGGQAKRSAGRASDKLQRGYANAEVRFKEAVDDYPLGFGAGFIGLGLLAGLLLPRSAAEDEWFGESADQIKDAVTDKGGDLLERGKEVASRVAEKAIDEAERQGISVDSASSTMESFGEKIGSVVEAVKEEGKIAAQEEHLTPDDLKAEVKSGVGRVKNKASEQMGSE